MKRVLPFLLGISLINIYLIPSAKAEIPSVTVMSRNIYLGADVGRALELIPNLPAAAQYMWDQVKQTDFSKRAKILAREINQSSPDVIGLQEATIWYCKKYPWSKKVEVFNFTEQLLDNLNGRYELVSKDGVKALNPGFSINPIPFLTKVNDEQTFKEVFGRSSAACGFETGDALLVKKSDNLEVIEVGNSEYEDSYPIVPTIMTIYRGYSWADIKVNGVPTRFVTTHLESLWDENKVPNSAKQAMQLVSDLSNTKMPVIVMGDFNDNPTDKGIKEVLNSKGTMEEVGLEDFFNPCEKLFKKGFNTLAHWDQLHLFDQLLVSDSFLPIRKNADKLFFLKAEIYNPAYLSNLSGKYRGYPKRSFVNNRFSNGFSDHYPVYISLIKQKKL